MVTTKIWLFCAHFAVVFPLCVKLVRVCLLLCFAFIPDRKIFDFNSPSPTVFCLLHIKWASSIYTHIHIVSGFLFQNDKMIRIDSNTVQIKQFLCGGSCQTRIIPSFNLNRIHVVLFFFILSFSQSVLMKVCLLR